MLPMMIDEEEEWEEDDFEDEDWEEARIHLPFFG
jgi:hypothetical protein